MLRSDKIVHPLISTGRLLFKLYGSHWYLVGKELRWSKKPTPFKVGACHCFYPKYV